MYPKKFDLEPGAVYEGGRGRQREIISIDGEVVTYRVVMAPDNRHPVGSVETTGAKYFRAWAQEEVA